MLILPVLLETVLLETNIQINSENKLKQTNYSGSLSSYEVVYLKRNPPGIVVPLWLQ